MGQESGIEAFLEQAVEDIASTYWMLLSRAMAPSGSGSDTPLPGDGGTLSRTLEDAQLDGLTDASAAQPLVRQILISALELLPGATPPRDADAWQRHWHTQCVKPLSAQLQISSAQLRVRGYGEELPIAPNTTAEGRAKNRRVELTVINREELRQIHQTDHE